MITVLFRLIDRYHDCCSLTFCAKIVNLMSMSALFVLFPGTNVYFMFAGIGYNIVRLCHVDLKKESFVLLFVYCYCFSVIIIFVSGHSPSGYDLRAKLFPIIFRAVGEVASSLNPFTQRNNTIYSFTIHVFLFLLLFRKNKCKISGDEQYQCKCKCQCRGTLVRHSKATFKNVKSNTAGLLKLLLQNPLSHPLLVYYHDCYYYYVFVALAMTASPFSMTGFFPTTPL